MNSWIVSGLLVNVVYLVVLGVFGGPLWLVGGLGVLWLVQVVGAMLLTAGRFRWGAYLVGGGCVAFVPVGLVGLWGVKQLFEDLRDGELSDEHVEAMLASRPWQLAAIGFGLTGVAGLTLALVWMSGELAEVPKLVQVLSAVLVGLAAGLEAVMLWRNMEQAYRLGMMLCLAGLGAAALAGFYLYNYVAVALLCWPVYLGWMLYQGRERWTGFDTLSSPEA